MTGTGEITATNISSAIREIKKIKPEFELMFDLYERIFIEQENAAGSLHLDERRLTETIAESKRDGERPLVSISQFIIDFDSAARLFMRLCAILLSSEGELAASVRVIRDALDREAVSLRDSYSAFTGEDEAFFYALESDLRIDKQAYSFLLYNSMKPSLRLFAQRASAFLDPENPWEKGTCPICGSMPEMSVFGKNGARTLVCSFCNHQWPSKRIYCPFCENTDHESLQYFSIEDEEEYRVDVCDKCHRYIKTIDTQKVSRYIYLPLEYLATPYIDYRFREMGFNPGVSISVPDQP